MKFKIICVRENESTVFPGCLGISSLAEPETKTLHEAIEALFEYWDRGTPVHASALVVQEFRDAVSAATRNVDQETAK